MKRENRKVAIFICFVLAALSAPIIYLGIDLLFFTDYQLKKKFSSIHIGASKEEVLAMLGPPDKQDITFRLGQYEGFEQEYSKAEKSGSKYYLFWYGEIDTVYVVGLNDRHQVMFKSYGGT